MNRDDLIKRVDDIRQMLLQYAGANPNDPTDIVTALQAALFGNPSYKAQEAAKRILGDKLLTPLIKLVADMSNALSQTPVRNSDGSFFQRKKSWKEDPNLYPAFWDRYLHDDCILIAISNQDNSPKVPTPDSQELVENIKKVVERYLFKNTGSGATGVTGITSEVEICSRVSEVAQEILDEIAVMRGGK